MIVFAVIEVSNAAVIQTALETHFPGDFLKLSFSNWLVAGRGITAKDVSDKLGISEGQSNGIVFTTAGYYGRAPGNVWEWVGAKLAQT